MGVGWWLWNQQCVDGFLLDFHRTQLALNCLQCSSWPSRVVHLFISFIHLVQSRNFCHHRGINWDFMDPGRSDGPCGNLLPYTVSD